MTSFRKSLLTNQLKSNVIYWINSKLLDAGYYRNIKRSDKDFENNDLSRFVLDNTNTAVASGLSWKSPKNNWVYESDISLPSGASAAIVPSGVYINDTFYLPGHATYPHYFDYPKGKVVFTGTTKPATTAKVQVEYSHKEYSIYLPNPAEIFNLHNDYFAGDGIKDNDFPFNRRSTPCICVEVDGHDFVPMALGGGKNAIKRIYLHVIGNSRNHHLCSDIADLLSYEQFTNLTLIDVDKIPEILNYRGEKAGSFQNYKTLRDNPTYEYSLGFFSQIEPIRVSSQFEDYFRIRLDLTMEIRGVS